MPDAIDTAQAACEQNTQDAIDAHRARQEARLRRVDFTHHGERICFGCDEPIAIERMQLEPATKCCQACGTEMEQQMKRESTWM